MVIIDSHKLRVGNNAGIISSHHEGTMSPPLLLLLQSSLHNAALLQHARDADY
jgi:hypothetical protein